MHLTIQQQEHDDLAWAIAMSRQSDAGRETGIVGQTEGQAIFGPAHREYYDADQWAMTHLSDAAVVGTNAR